MSTNPHWILTQIPRQAVRCVIRARHAPSEKDGHDDERVLTKAGYEFVERAGVSYRELTALLEPRFGKVLCVSSPKPRTRTTLALLMRPQHVLDDTRITQGVRVITDTTRALLEEELRLVDDFLIDPPRGSSFVFSVGHQPHLGEQAQRYGIKPKQADLPEGHAFIYFLNEAGKVLKVIRFDPV